MTVKCTGSPDCNITRCDHFHPHENIPSEGVDYSACETYCFDGDQCKPVDDIDIALAGVAESARELVAAVEMSGYSIIEEVI